MRPLAFLELAEELATGDEGQKRESVLRTVVNRAYLGALLEAARYMEPVREKAYPQNRYFYTNVEDDLGRHIGPGAKDKLTTLREYRAEADYEITIPLRELLPERSVRLSREIAKVVKEKFDHAE